MTQDSNALSALVFKEVPGGYVYRAPNPWVFGKRDHYLVNAEQRDKILALMSPAWSVKTLSVSLGGLLILLFILIVALNVHVPGFETTIWVAAAVVSVPLFIVAQSLLARRALGRVQSILDGAARTDQQVAWADIRKTQATRPPMSYEAQKRGIKLTAFTSIVSLLGAVAMVLDHKPATAILFSSPVVIFGFNAALNALLTYASLRSLRQRRLALVAGTPETLLEGQVLPRRGLKALGLALVAYILVVSVIGVRREFSDLSWGQRAESRGDYKSAIASFSKALQADPDNTIALLARARSSIATGETVAAIADLTRVLELQPANVDGYRWRGQANRLANRHDGAIADYTHVLELDPNDRYANYFRGVSYAANNNHAAAIADFTRALEIKATDTFAYVSRGRSLQATGQYPAAIADVSKAIEINPKYDNAYLLLGNLHAQLKQTDLAIVDYTHYIEFKPIDVAGYVSRAQSFLAKSDRDAAIVDLSKVIELQPENYFARFMRGMIRESKGDLEPAIEDFSKAIEIQPKSAGAYSRRAGVYAKVDAAAHAIADYTKAIELAPQDTGVLANRAEFYQRQGNMDKAIADYRTMLTLPKSTPADAIRQEQARISIERLTVTAGRAAAPPAAIKAK